VGLDTPFLDMPLWNRVLNIQLSVGIKKGEFTAQFIGQGRRRPDLDKYIHRPANVLRKLGKSNGIVLRPFVTDLNLSLEVAITTPLKVATESVKKYYSTENVTDTDAYMRCHLGAKWRGELCI
jgi:hypothetical protein